MHKNEKGFAHHLGLIVIILVLVIGFVGWRVVASNRDKSVHPNEQKGSADLGDPNSSDPVTKGKALSNGQCSGSGSSSLTRAPMDVKDLDDIQPMGGMIGAHVTPIDHEYWWGKGLHNTAVDTYPVYADADGVVTAIQFADDGQKQAWWVTISHSCTFHSNYNLLTSISADLKSKLPANWGPNNNGGIKIPIKAGQVIGKVGHQSLDFQVWDTTKTLKGLLHPTAYNNREPWKINTVNPLDYFSSEVKAQVLPKYMRTTEPRDGRIDYDVSGEAVGTWFLKGTNGYAGANNAKDAATGYHTGHLALAYDFLDPSAMVFSIGNYEGQAKQFTVVGNGPDWKSVTPASGVVKYQLSDMGYQLPGGSGWMGGFATGIKLKAASARATVLIQLTEKEIMKVEVFPNKTASQVSGFDSNAKTYDRGQDAYMLTSNTAT